MSYQSIRMVIVSKPSSDLPAVGMVIPYFGPLRHDLTELDGGAIPRHEFPELMAVIGDTYCPPRVQRQDWVSRVLRRLRLADRTAPNPNYDPDRFRVPDLRQSRLTSQPL